MADLKQTILEEHKTLERVKKLKATLTRIVTIGKFSDMVGMVNLNVGEKGMLDGFLLLSEVLEDVLNGADAEGAFKVKLEELKANFDEDKD
ncbi:hypothetical protein [Streptococcus lutetiensis]|uniref:hypothetical protein n=1 Tax=Streptococcus lutetiensis TaxID=150055 RepID=UPI001963C4DE|nr:hypothetical protein [Streptococcus lutetiensis]